MPTLTICRVVRTSVLLGPERMAQALKIILTFSTQKEANHASSAICPRLDEPTRENGYHRESIGGDLHAYVAAHDHTVLPEHIFS